MVNPEARVTVEELYSAAQEAVKIVHADQYPNYDPTSIELLHIVLAMIVNMGDAQRRAILKTIQSAGKV